MKKIKVEVNMWLNIPTEDMGLRDLLIRAIQEYGFSLETFHIATEISMNDLHMIYNGDAVDLDDVQTMHLFGILIHLIDALPIDDSYTIDLIETLNNIFKINNHSICKIIDVKLTTFESYISNPKDLCEKEKNKITIGVLHLYAAIAKTSKEFPQ